MAKNETNNISRIEVTKIEKFTERDAHQHLEAIKRSLSMALSSAESLTGTEQLQELITDCKRLVIALQKEVKA